MCAFFGENRGGLRKLANQVKTYVELGLGVGLIAAMAYRPTCDAGLRLLDAPELFELNTSRLALRRGHYLRDYALRFILECTPTLTTEQIKEAAFPKVSIA